MKEAPHSNDQQISLEGFNMLNGTNLTLSSDVNQVTTIPKLSMYHPNYIQINI